LFSAKAILVKLAYRHEVDALSLLMLRMLFALPFFIGIGWWYYSANKNDGQIELIKKYKWRLLILGLLGYYIASLFDLKGLELIDASLERMILFLYPTVVLVLSFFIYRIPIKISQVIAICIGYIGMYLVFSGNIIHHGKAAVIQGSSLVLVSTFTFSLYLVGTGELSKKIGSIVYNSITMTFAAIAILIHNSIVHGFNLFDFSTPVYFYGLAISVMCTVIPSYLIVESIKRVGASQSSIIGFIGPISTIILAVLILGERISLLQGIGSLVVFSSVVYIILVKQRSR